MTCPLWAPEKLTASPWASVSSSGKWRDKGLIATLVSWDSMSIGGLSERRLHIRQAPRLVEQQSYLPAKLHEILSKLGKSEEGPLQVQLHRSDLAALSCLSWRHQIGWCYKTLELHLFSPLWGQETGGLGPHPVLCACLALL